MNLSLWLSVLALTLLVVIALRVRGDSKAGPLTVAAPPARAIPAPALWSDWAGAVRAAEEGVSTGVGDWARAARLSGKVSGPAARIPERGLKSDVSFDGNVAQSMRKAGVPEDVAAAFAAEAWAAWKAWADNYTVEIPKAFPKFAALGAPNAPPTQGAPQPLALGSSAGERAITRDLAGALKQRLGKRAGDRAAAQAVDSFASWYRARFAAWKNQTTLVGLTGRGLVPSFAPPYVPVGPVVGDVSGQLASPHAF